MNQNVHEYAKSLMTLFSAPEKWTKKYQARTKDSEGTRALASDATCWCMLGGIIKVMGVESPPKVTDTELHGVIAGIIREKYPPYGRVGDDTVVMNWNDEDRCTIAEVQAVIAEAVARTAPKEQA